MNTRLRLAGLYLPAGLKKRKLAELVRLTARAFEAAPPSLEGLSLSEMRRRYAEFSRLQAEQALTHPEGLAPIESRLFDGAYHLGSDIRRELRVSTRRDVMAAARVLYRALEIDLRGDEGGAIVVRRCAFSREYSPEVCGLMSAADAGLLAGLAAGGRLVFSARISEGAQGCRARFTFPEAD